MSDHQDYRPFRTEILDRDDLRRLSSLRPAIAVRDTVANWLIIAACWAIVAWNPVWWTTLPAIVIIGTRFYALAIIGHDGLHRRLFDDLRKNDNFNDLLIVGAIGAITRINRNNHIEHHRITALPGDPDRHKYLHEDKEPTIPFLLFLSGLASLWPTLRNIFLGSAQRPAASTSSSHTARDLAIIISWQVGLFALLTSVIGWWAYPVLWLLPVYVFAYLADLIRVFCEHSMLKPDAIADEQLRMVHYESNWLEKQFFAPQNMNCHVAHHLWPSIPYYNLPEAETKALAWGATHGSGDAMEFRSSYLRYILDYFVWRLRNPALAGVAAR